MPVQCTKRSVFLSAELTNTPCNSDEEQKYCCVMESLFIKRSYAFLRIIHCLCLVTRIVRFILQVKVHYCSFSLYEVIKMNVNY